MRCRALTGWGGGLILSGLAAGGLGTAWEDPAMTLVGVLCLVAGLSIFGLIMSDNAPAVLLELPVPVLAWLVLAGVGAVLIFLNRRPGN